MRVADVAELAETVVERSALSFESSDKEEGRAFISETLRASTSGLRTDREGPFGVRVHGMSIGRLAVSRVRFASAVAMSAPPVDDDYIIPLALTGRVIMSAGGREVSTGPGVSCLLPSHQGVKVQVGEGYDYVVLNAPGSRLESLAAQISGGSRSGRIRLPAVNQSVPPGLVRFIAGALQLLAGDGAGEMGDRVESVVLESVLLAGAGPLGLEPRLERVQSRAVLRRAQEYMLADLSRPPSLTSVAAYCGVSVRTIQNAFRTVLHTTPTAWLRRERLSRTRAMLLARNPAFVSITDVAIAHGFVHMGDFAAQFRAEYGVNPSRLTLGTETTA